MNTIEVGYLDELKRIYKTFQERLAALHAHKYGWLMGRREVAKALGCSSATVWRWRNAHAAKDPAAIAAAELAQQRS